MSRIGQMARAHGFDVLIVLLVITGILEVAIRPDAPTAPRMPIWFVVPVLAVLVLPLFARRRFPFAAPTVYWLLAVVVSFIDGWLIPFVESVFVLGMAASAILGSLRDRMRAQTGLAVVLGGTVIIVFNKPGHSVADLFFIPLLFGICWLGGFTLHLRAEQAEAAKERAAQAERERETAARLAVAEERARIARELHDVVAHAVSVMVLQAGAVRHGHPDVRAADRDALKTVEQVGRTALAEMRRLLAAMRSDGEEAEFTPQPGLDQLPELSDQIGRAGLPVRLQVHGERFPLPHALELSAYRIIQEGLTNALKHGGASQAEVTVNYEPGELQVEVRDDGLGTTAGNGLGHGLVGIRERVKIYDGEMAAGSAATGGFVLSARLPVSSDRP
ncbi:MAG TPA: sensor histidine kinase [Propionibacteriaceae bacterium]|nr:sensor histidine kinase [Propionibacteriaceae bacterium]